MKRALLIVMLLFAAPARAADIDGVVVSNGGSCAVDGICALEVKTPPGGLVRFVWGWEAPIPGCDPDEGAIRVASKLSPGQSVHVRAPDRFAQVENSGLVVYYLCEGSAVQMQKP